ncbi:MAG: fatty acid desaturase [Burkholderiales bacterium]|nr:fatty acid desaturase [Burkholderiales bacterium]
MTAAARRRASIFREPAGAVPNSLALGWTALAWIVSFALMAAPSGWVAAAGVLLCTHAMVLAAYLVHEAAHYTLFASPAANRAVGEAASFVAGASYASFERIRHMHLRHHRDRADVTCFDFKALMRRRPAVRRTLEVLEALWIPATEVLMHLQVVWRPFFVASQRRHLPRAAAMLALRGALLVALGLASLQALLLYFVAAGLLLHVLNFFDAFHHTFEQFFAEADTPVPAGERDRAYEQANTYSNVISTRWPWLNLLTLNFGYHNAHHERAAVPWYRLPALHAELHGDLPAAALLPLRELLVTWVRHRVRRVACDDYGTLGTGRGRADTLVGAHGVSFLTVV